MKKVILTICGAVLLAASLAGCCMKHEWAEATCTEPKKCVKCGETEGVANGHKWKAATCTTPKTCETCGKTEGEALGHMGRQNHGEAEDLLCVRRDGREPDCLKGTQV